MGINNRQRFYVADPTSNEAGWHTYQTQSISGNFTGSQTDPSSYRKPVTGEMWELRQMRIYCSVGAPIDIAMILTDEDGIEYGRLSMDSNSPTSVPDEGVLSWNAGHGSVMLLPGWRLYAKWYGDPVPVGSWNWQYTARIHEVSRLETDLDVEFGP